MRHIVLGLLMAFLLVVNQAAASGTAPVAYLSNDAGPNVLAVDTSSSTSQPTSIPVGSVGTTTYGVAVGPKGAKVYVTGGQSTAMGCGSMWQTPSAKTFPSSTRPRTPESRRSRVSADSRGA